MQRILDVDVDFFVQGTAITRAPDDEPLDAAQFPPWPLDEVISFLRDRCDLRDRLPGLVVKNHGELFPLWRGAIAEGKLVPPFHVTHVDAHADLGFGDPGIRYLMTSLILEETDNRPYPETGLGGMNDGNYLAFCIACRWISDLVYVFTEGGKDVPRLLMEGFDPEAPNIQIAGLTRAEFTNLINERPLTVEHLEPRVPFASMPWQQFQADEPFDVVCLARSPAFTPPESGAIFEDIRKRFLDEDAFR